jgi:hypothetical protein
MKIIKSSAFLLLALALGTILTPGLRAQRAQLVSLGPGLARAGFYPTHTTQTGLLFENRSSEFSVWLRGNVEYVFRGTCDDDCSDLDLELRNASGVLIDRDTAWDDVPEVRVTPPTSGYYRVRVIMSDCLLEPCAYAVGTFGR